MKKSCNVENMTKLVEALESGNYKQTTGTLCNGESFCCLGVATDLYGKEKTYNWETYSSGGSRLFRNLKTNTDLIETNVLLPEVQDWLGIDQENPELYFEDGWIQAATLNDEGLSFKEIAKAFRETYL
jgi:hypothetical protein